MKFIEIYKTIPDFNSKLKLLSELDIVPKSQVKPKYPPQFSMLLKTPVEALNKDEWLYLTTIFSEKLEKLCYKVLLWVSKSLRGYMFSKPCRIYSYCLS